VKDETTRLPAIRVIGEPVPAEPAERPRRHVHDAIVTESRTDHEPVSLSLRGQRVYTVAELEARLAGDLGPCGIQFDCEDQSDRNSWDLLRPDQDLAEVASATVCHRDVA